MDNTLNRLCVRIGLLVLVLLGSACGMRGDLYLPPEPAASQNPAAVQVAEVNIKN